MRQTRVLVADDSEGFGVFLGRFVASHSDMTVVGRAVNGREAVDLTDTLEPDVVLMDLYMGEMDGFEATAALSETHPEVKVVVLTGHYAADNERRSLEAGARAFILKADADQRLIGVIRALSTGMIDSFGRTHRAQGPGGPGAPS